MKKVKRSETQTSTTVAEKTGENQAALTEGQRIWSEIKDKTIEMFAIPGKTQVVSDYCKYMNVEPSRCFLVPKVAAFIPALETLLGNAYSYEVQDKYIIIGRPGKIIQNNDYLIIKRDNK